MGEGEGLGQTPAKMVRQLGGEPKYERRVPKQCQVRKEKGWRDAGNQLCLCSAPLLHQVLPSLERPPASALASGSE